MRTGMCVLSETDVHENFCCDVGRSVRDWVMFLAGHDTWISVLSVPTDKRRVLTSMKTVQFYIDVDCRFGRMALGV
jgi:hypothetical protein